MEFQHTLGGALLRHSLEVHQSPDDETWPGGALWDCGVLLSQLLLGLAGIEDMTLRSTFLEEETTCHIVPNKDNISNNASRNGKQRKNASNNNNSTDHLIKKSNKKLQSRTTTQIATRLKDWIQQTSQKKKTTPSYLQTWKETVEEVLCRTPQLRVLELGCGVGLTGLVASVALGSVTTILTDLTGVVDALTVTNVERNAQAASSGGSNSYKKNKPCKSASFSFPDRLSRGGKYPCRSIRHFKGVGNVLSMPLCWGNVQEGQQVLDTFAFLQPFAPSESPSKGGTSKGRHNKVESNDTKKTAGANSFDEEDALQSTGRHRYPHLILLGDVAYQHKPGAPSHFDILVETLQQCMPPIEEKSTSLLLQQQQQRSPTLLLFGTRLRMPASMDLLLLLQEHFHPVLPEPIPAHVLDPALRAVKHNMTIHIFTNKSV